MKRDRFIKLLGMGLVTAGSIRSFAKTMADLPETGDTMPLLFIGHGSPMNAVSDNSFTRDLTRMGSSLKRPKAILCISAHWLTQGTRVDVSPSPKMIYDMGGFPKELYEVQYPAPGAPDFARETKALISLKENVDVEEAVWGFDHGNWSIMKWLFPNADIPVYQMSIDYYKPMQWHYDLAAQLADLRKKGVLIVGSGNITHNLRKFAPEVDAKPVDWALEFDHITKEAIETMNHDKLIRYRDLGELGQVSHPEPSHWLPLMYILGLQKDTDEVNHFHTGIQHGSFSMRSIKFG